MLTGMSDETPIPPSSDAPPDTLGQPSVESKTVPPVESSTPESPMETAVPPMESEGAGQPMEPVSPDAAALEDLVIISDDSRPSRPFPILPVAVAMLVAALALIFVILRKGQVHLFMPPAPQPPAQSAAVKPVTRAVAPKNLPQTAPKPVSAPAPARVAAPAVPITKPISAPVSAPASGSVSKAAPVPTLAEPPAPAPVIPVNPGTPTPPPMAAPTQVAAPEVKPPVAKPAPTPKPAVRLEQMKPPTAPLPSMTLSTSGLPEWKGTTSRIEKFKTIAVENAQSWKKTWNDAGFPGNPPVVDFDQYMVVGVFAGQKPAGTGVKLTGTEEVMPPSLIIYYKESPPAPGYTGKGVVEPYQLWVILKTALPIKFTRQSS
jgi:hypothetical protein